MIKPLLFLIALLGTQFSFAQHHMILGTVYGIDTLKSEEPPVGNIFKLDTSILAGVNICLLNNLETTEAGMPCTLGTVTDFDGKFSIVVPESLADRIRYIEVQAPGNITQVLPFPPDIYGRPLVLFMRPDSLEPSPPVPPVGPPVNKHMYVQKPAIYLYPTQQTKVSIKHSFKGTLGTTYPAYGNGWDVIADTNGSLLNTKDNRRYEYLFWDGKCQFPAAHFDYRDGFVVKKEESQAFLWKTLASIGLNNKEINDFVVYWLPQLEQHEQNFIHFRVNDDIDHSSVLTVVPQPDSWIRLFMELKPVPEGFSIPPQALPTCSRKGFTLVEWGGAKLEETLSLE
jgi:hypothetical protein